MKNRKGLIILSFLILTLTFVGMSSEAMGLESLIPKEDIPEGWALIEGPRIYIKRTLFEHIDGQAELFFKYGFQKSVFAIYQNKGNPNHQIELDIYDMGNVLQAFGIFSRFRNEDRPIGIGLDSFSDDHSALFCKGKYFVMLYSTESNPSILKEWAVKISSRISDHSPPPKEIGYFPKSGLKLGSIQYFPEGLLGYQFLKRGFQGTYIEKDEDKVEAKAKVEVKAEAKDRVRTEGKEFHLFLAVFKSSQEAMKGLKAYRDYLVRKGKVHSGVSNQLKGEDPYQRQILVIHKGVYLLGAAGFEKEEYAENLLGEFMRNIR